MDDKRPHTPDSRHMHNEFTKQHTCVFTTNPTRTCMLTWLWNHTLGVGDEVMLLTNGRNQAIALFFTNCCKPYIMPNSPAVVTLLAPDETIWDGMQSEISDQPGASTRKRHFALDYERRALCFWYKYVRLTCLPYPHQTETSWQPSNRKKLTWIRCIKGYEECLLSIHRHSLHKWLRSVIAGLLQHHIFFLPRRVFQLLQVNTMCYVCLHRCRSQSYPCSTRNSYSTSFAFRILTIKSSNSSYRRDLTKKEWRCFRS